MGDYRAVPRDVLPDALSGKLTVKKGAEPFEIHYKCQIRLGYFKNMKSNSVKLRVRKRATGVFPVVLLFVRRRENVNKAKPNNKRTLKTWVRFCRIRNIFGKSKAEMR